MMRSPLPLPTEFTDSEPRFSLVPQISVPRDTQERPDSELERERATKRTTMSNWRRSCRQKGRRFGAHRPDTKPRAESRSRELYETGPGRAVHGARVLARELSCPARSQACAGCVNLSALP